MISVITSITGGKDTLIDDQMKGDAQWIAYTTGESKTWEVRPPYGRFHDDRRNSRPPKILPHLYVDTEYSLYIDGNMQLLTTPEDLVKKYLKDHDIALFKHPSRDCAYKELLTIKAMGIDDPKDVEEQYDYYMKDTYAKEKGLFECGFILRRHTPQIRALNNEWWAQYCRFGKRDQPSFVYAINEVGVRVNEIDEPWDLRPNGAFRGNTYRLVNHLTART